MRSTEKVSLSIDTGALLLGRRAAARDGRSLSAHVSRLLLSDALRSDRPDPAADAEAERIEQLDLAEEDYWSDEGERRATG